MEINSTSQNALYMLYFQAETTIIVSLNSESDMEDVRSRKVYTTLLARAKGILSVLPAAMRPVHIARRAGQRTIYMKTVNSAFQHDLIRHGHGMRYAYGPVNRGKLNTLVAYRELNCCTPKMSAANN